LADPSDRESTIKIHYFHQLLADDDDVALRELAYLGAVPESCLLGGAVARALWLRDLVPCDHCRGPRERCHGTPVKGAEIALVLAEQDRLRWLLTGEQAFDVISEIMKGVR
jgi:hypothetical protein